MPSLEAFLTKGVCRRLGATGAWPPKHGNGSSEEGWQSNSRRWFTSSSANAAKYARGLLEKTSSWFRRASRERTSKGCEASLAKFNLRELFRSDEALPARDRLTWRLLP
jgi:hypothetical protein